MQLKGTSESVAMATSNIVTPVEEEIPIEAPNENVGAIIPEEIPSVFHKGVAISMWQNSGGKQTNWSDFANARGNCFGFFPKIMDRSDNTVTSDFWNKYAFLHRLAGFGATFVHVDIMLSCSYELDIVNAKSLGCNSFRLSLEWHRIEPLQGKIDQSAIQRYSRNL